MDPPHPINAAELGHSSVKASLAASKMGFSMDIELPLEAPCALNSTEQSGGRFDFTNFRKFCRIT